MKCPSASTPSRLSWHSLLSPGILGLLAPPPIKGDHLLSADASFTHWALLPLWPRLQPLGGKMKWFPVCSRSASSSDLPISLVISSEYAPDEDRANWMGGKKRSN